MFAVGVLCRKGAVVRLRASGRRVASSSVRAANGAMPRHAVAGDAPHAEIFTGFEASNNATGGYVGARLRLRQGTLRAGWRLRAVGAFGRYDYQGRCSRGGTVATTFDGEISYGAALIGYQFRRQALFLKFFAGIEGEDQHITPHDPNNSVQGSAVGLKLQAESWLDFSPHDISLARCVLWHGLSGILEPRADRPPTRTQALAWARGRRLGNEEYDAGGRRLRPFKSAGSSMTVSGGFTGNYLGDKPSGYVSLGLYRASEKFDRKVHCRSRSGSAGLIGWTSPRAGPTHPVRTRRFAHSGRAFCARELPERARENLS